jgi:NTP pyrophosphatase (non-canonical NTP hydrolase)
MSNAGDPGMPGRADAGGAADKDDVASRDRQVSSLTLAEYERAAARTINQSLTPDERLVDAAAGLAEEGGEVVGLVRKHLFMRHALDRARLTTELGDALWCLTGVAAAIGVSLDEVAQANLEKLRRRYPDGYSDVASVRRVDAPPDTA